jgi:hypothetical protein
LLRLTADLRREAGHRKLGWAFAGAGWHRAVFPSMHGRRRGRELRMRVGVSGRAEGICVRNDIVFDARLNELPPPRMPHPRSSRPPAPATGRYRVATGRRAPPPAATGRHGSPRVATGRHGSPRVATGRRRKTGSRSTGLLLEARHFHWFTNRSEAFPQASYSKRGISTGLLIEARHLHRFPTRSAAFPLVY